MKKETKKTVPQWDLSHILNQEPTICERPLIRTTKETYREQVIYDYYVDKI